MRENSVTPAAKRLFLALWPDDVVRRQVVAIQKGLSLKGGRVTPVDNIHLTLAFLGSVTADKSSELVRFCDGLVTRGFTLTLTKVGYWKKAGIVRLAPEVTPPELSSLAESLNSGISGLGLATDPRPYSPHITLARKVRHAVTPGTIEPITWRCNGFSLVESITRAEGAEYRVLQNWPLMG